MKNPTDDTEAFEAELARNRDRLYGMALFFEAVELLYPGTTETAEARRRQSRDLIRDGAGRLGRADELLDKVKTGQAQAAELTRFDFALGEGYPERDALLNRADVLARTYDTLFPGRDRGRDFSEEEKLRLMEAAAA
jgi:hypothetical protein